jgi:hypothetical protein
MNHHVDLLRPKMDVQNRMWLHQAQVLLRMAVLECLVVAKNKQDRSVISGRSGQCSMLGQFIVLQR